MNLIPRFCSLLALMGAVAGFGAPPAQAEMAGAYLAARSADMASDYPVARQYLTQALSADPSNPILTEGLMNALIGMGDLPAALPVARRLHSLGVDSPAAPLLLLVEKAKKGDFATLAKELDAGAKVSGPLFDELVRAWSHLGKGSMAEALAVFDTLAKTEGMAPFAAYHKAMALALVGDIEGADAIFSGPDGGLMVLRRAVLAHVQVLSQLDRPKDALERLNAAFGREADPELDPFRVALTQQIEGKTDSKLAFDMVRDARDGIAEVFFVLASVLQTEAPPQQTLIHARLVDYLRPEHIDNLMLAGALLEAIGQTDLAIALYSRVEGDNPAYLAAQGGKAQALYKLGRKEDAIETAKALAEKHGAYRSVHEALGELLRRDERFAESAEAYGRGIALIDTPEGKDWLIYFSRGISYEQAKLWDKAEPDLRKALELRPNQPDVLNYLGYSLLDRNLKIDESLDLIKKAVELNPRSGHIIDSLAWGYFLTGRYPEALTEMERASVLLPVDPIVTDHLGDVYWAVGRRAEAQFQWRRALSFEPDEKQADLIRRKLAEGLDKVLADEGLPALDARGKK